MTRILGAGFCAAMLFSSWTAGLAVSPAGAEPIPEGSWQVAQARGDDEDDKRRKSQRGGDREEKKEPPRRSGSPQGKPDSKPSSRRQAQPPRQEQQQEKPQIRRSAPVVKEAKPPFPSKEEPKLKQVQPQRKPSDFKEAKPPFPSKEEPKLKQVQPQRKPSDFKEAKPPFPPKEELRLKQVQPQRKPSDFKEAKPPFPPTITKDLRAPDRGKDGDKQFGKQKENFEPKLKAWQDKDDDRRNAKDDRRDDRGDRKDDWAEQKIRRLDDLKQHRRERVEDGGRRVVIEEPGNRTIVREQGRMIIRHDDGERFRRRFKDTRVERRHDGSTETVFIRPDGVHIVSVVDSRGRLLHRYRRHRNGRIVVLIDNRRYHRPGFVEGLFLGAVLNLRPPVIRIPREKYIVDYEEASYDDVYEALSAPPVDETDLEDGYSLDEIRYNQYLRERMRRIDLDSIYFDTGSWEVSPDQYSKLERIAKAINDLLERNPDEIIMIEGYTDAVGSDEDNMTLSDHRAEAVAMILSDEFGVPPENLVTQGYGEQFLKVQTDGPEPANRIVAVRRVTPLLARTPD